jgi:molybdenum cofactor biosynthesis enzyme MoaA
VPSLRLSFNQQRVLYDHLRSSLMHARVRDDPDSRELLAILERIKPNIEGSFCSDCFRPSIHAKGKCRTCYMREYRKTA